MAQTTRFVSYKQKKLIYICSILLFLTCRLGFLILCSIDLKLA